MTSFIHVFPHTPTYSWGEKKKNFLHHKQMTQLCYQTIKLSTHTIIRDSLLIFLMVRQRLLNKQVRMLWMGSVSQWLQKEHSNEQGWSGIPLSTDMQGSACRMATFCCFGVPGRWGNWLMTLQGQDHFEMPLWVEIGSSKHGPVGGKSSSSGKTLSTLKPEGEHSKTTENMYQC